MISLKTSLLGADLVLGKHSQTSDVWIIVTVFNNIKVHEIFDTAQNWINVAIVSEQKVAYAL